MLFSEKDYMFMYSALQQAQYAFDEDEVPVGAVIVKENKIIARGFNQNKKLNDPTAHAEMIAITSAANYLNAPFLEQCSIYITLEPCLMCTGAILNSRISNIYFAAFEPKSGALGSILNAAHLNENLKVYSGLLESESKNLLQEFFKKKRTNYN
ncbi:MAG: tRNA-specific adenosine deaminase [Ignavibacteriae bacterium]|nr:tRNA-specific adenosine deaminase [Ignavibacteriota bacterium]